jgi:hypothetical protein
LVRKTNNIIREQWNVNYLKIHIFHWFIFFSLWSRHTCYIEISSIFFFIFVLQRLQTVKIMRSHSHLYWILRLNTHDFKLWRQIFFYTNLYCWLSLLFFHVQLTNALFFRCRFYMDFCRFFQCFLRVFWEFFYGFFTFLESFLRVLWGFIESFLFSFLMMVSSSGN